ncbi:hypothetical protein OH492_27505 [Vibrio chagasii]|nr:hypothetical protein [Vibrio chagasii]
MTGGHLTHGARPALSDKWFNAVQCSVDRDTLEIDYEAVPPSPLSGRNLK